MSIYKYLFDNDLYLAERLGGAGELGDLTRPELPRLLGLGTRAALVSFLTAYGFGTYTENDLEREQRDLQRLGF